MKNSQSPILIGMSHLQVHFAWQEEENTKVAVNLGSRSHPAG